MAAVVPTTRLSAVNHMLSAIGESPVTVLSPPATDDVTFAVNILDEIDLEVQTKGWHFNVDYDIVLVLDGASKFAIPADFARIVVDSARHPNVDLTWRDDAGTLRLYDKKNQTFVLKAGMKAEIVKLVDFEKTPQAYRRYVSVRALRVFQDRVQGSNAHHVYSQRDELLAWKTLKQHEGLADTRTIFDNYSAARVIDRRYPTVQGGA